MADSQTKLKNLLRELFQLDSADLDFGIYRIMNSKRSEIERFLDNDLLPQIKEAFLQYKSSDSAEIKVELDKVIQQLKHAGVDPELSPKVRELREKLSTAIDVSALENQVFSDLFNFFRRYYDEGDFLSLRRYKEGVYAIPYEGEEVKLYWANHDQYYIKSGEYLRDYTFKLADGRRVHFRLAAADVDKDNNKSPNGNDRRFILAEGKPIAEANGELVIRFGFQPDPEKRRQDALNRQATKAILEAPPAATWLFALAALDPSEADPERTVLSKHLKNYTARNTFDYFIHKNVDAFLRRELDFFIKNEVMHLDDIESASVPRVEQYLSRIKVFRRIAHKIIDFVAQLENFQKKLWLKKKFVVETQYCITLDRIPEEFYSEISANDGLRQEWIDLYGIDEIAGDLTRPGYSVPLTADFLKAHSMLIVDTRHFSPTFTARLVEAMGDLDEQIDGLLIHSENFQALSLLQARFRGATKCIYIDPPYNTDAGPIDYKNGYRSSSWLSMIAERLTLSRQLLSDDGVLCITIDDYQVHELANLLNNEFGRDNQLGTAVIRNNPSGRSTVRGLSVCHEYAFFYRNGDATLQRLPRSEKQLERFSEEEGIYVDWRNFRKDGGAVTHRAERPKQYYPIYVKTKERTLRIPDLSWNKAQRSWNALEEPTEGDVVVYPIDEKGQERVWSLNHISALENLSELEVRVTKEGLPLVYRRHRPSDGVLPRSWWDKNTYAAREYGSATLTQLFGASAFSFAKSPFAVQDSLWVSGLANESDREVLDYFAGSGTTGHAVINLNRQDGGHRKFILVETGAYFDTVLLPRIKKVVFSPEWSSGKPKRMATQEELERGPRVVKIIHLESYEDTLNNLDLSRTMPQQSCWMRTVTSARTTLFAICSMWKVRVASRC